MGLPDIFWVAGDYEASVEAFMEHAQKEELYDANIALMDQHAREPLPGDRYVVVLTGRKS